jgi:tRNA A37 methylthiotransferase MiaB
VRLLSEQGVKEVTLLGQNVNSYAYSDEVAGGGETDFLSMLSAGNDDGKTREEDVVDPESVATPPGMSAEVAAAGGTPFVGYAEGFSSRYRADKRREGSVQFAALLDRVAAIDPEMRVRFTSPHPKDFPDEVLEVIARRPNVCNCLHMPAQSGNTRTLENMARGYTREAYLNLIDRVKAKIPGCAVTTDIIVGFCGETEEEHEDTVTLMDRVAYEQAFMFAYSERDGTSAARKMEDDVPEDVKQRRLQEVIDAFRGAAARHQEAEIGRVHLCSVEGASKKNDQELTGKTDTSKWVVFANDPVGVYGGDVGEELVGGEKQSVVVNGGAGEKLATPEPGEYVAVRVTGCSTGTLFGECLGRTTLTAFHEKHGYAWVEPEASGKKATAAAGAR